MARQKVCVTGAAGFIGFHLCRALLAQQQEVVGIDSLNAYYDPKLKRDRLGLLGQSEHFRFVRLDLADRARTAAFFAENRCEIVFHMAAQAGVRYSIDNPHAYVDSNLVTFLNVLEGCRTTSVKHLVYASSSSVYGTNRKLPFSVADGADHPVSLYGATKRANELMAHSYSHLFNLPTTGLRFFTVYGPWGRPDMALYKFADAIVRGTPIEIYNHGRMKRDFTYIDDVIEGVVRVANIAPTAADPPGATGRRSPGTSDAPFRIYNIGNHHPVELEHLIGTLEKHLGKKAIKSYVPMQAGDVEQTFADIDDLQAAIGFCPHMTIEEGVARFVAWYRDYHRS